MRFLHLVVATFCVSIVKSAPFDPKSNEKLGAELGPVIQDLLNGFFQGLSGSALDPLSIMNLTIPRIPLVGGYMDAKIAFTQVSGISTCRADNVFVEILSGGGFIPVEYNGTMDLSFTLPSLHVSGSYWLDGVIAGVLPLYGEGPYTLDILNAAFGGGGGITVNVVSGRLQLHWLELRLTFTDLITNFEGLLGGGDFGNEINEMVSVLGTEIFTAILPTITSALSEGIVVFLNNALEGVNIWDIIPKP